VAGEIAVNQHVVIVEDEANIAESLSFLLEREGCRVTVLNDGATAYEQITRAEADAVVLDVMLPNRSGFDVLSDLRAKDASLPVMMLTAKGQSRDRERALELGASAFVTKPFSNADIVARVKALLSDHTS
jgi:DNA-binding response OmpR family regulator